MKKNMKSGYGKEVTTYQIEGNTQKQYMCTFTTTKNYIAFIEHCSDHIQKPAQKPISESLRGPYPKRFFKKVIKKS